jgi:beta-fructofuranosidase
MGFNPDDMRQNFIFNELQFGVFKMNEENTFYFRLVHYGNYIELSMDGEVKRSLIDYTFSGEGIGLHSASSAISLQNSVVKILPDPIDEYASQEDAQKLPGQANIAP